MKDHQGQRWMEDQSRGRKMKSSQLNPIPLSRGNKHHGIAMVSLSANNDDDAAD